MSVNVISLLATCLLLLEVEFFWVDVFSAVTFELFFCRQILFRLLGCFWTWKNVSEMIYSVSSGT